MNLSEAELKRFRVRVSAGKPDQCWLWVGPVDGCGYGKLFVSGRYIGAHRVAYSLAKGPIPKGLCVTHSCDTPPCCNPSHLRAATHAENMAEMSLRGRACCLRGDASPARHQERRGEANGNSRLKPVDILAIRQRFKEGRTKTQLAIVFGVSATHIDRIVNRRQWKHICQDHTGICLRQDREEDDES